MKKFFKGFIYAFNGVKLSFQERNMKVHAIAAIVVLIVACFFPLSSADWVELLFAIGLVLSAETFNTAIEQLVNLIRDDCHVPYANKKLGKAKDLSAGAVLIAATAAAVIGVRIFLPHVLRML